MLVTVISHRCRVTDGESVGVIIISHSCKVRHGESVGVRESSFNMTRGVKILRGGGLRKFLDTKRGALKKLGGGAENFILQNQQEGGEAHKNSSASEGDNKHFKLQI